MRTGDARSEELRKLRIVNLPSALAAGVCVCVDKDGDRLDDLPQVRQGTVSFDPLLTAEEVTLRLRVRKD